MDEKTETLSQMQQGAGICPRIYACDKVSTENCIRLLSNFKSLVVRPGSLPLKDPGRPVQGHQDEPIPPGIKHRSIWASLRRKHTLG